MLSLINNTINTAAFQFMQSLASGPLNTTMVILSESFWIVIPLLAVWLYYKKDRSVFSFVSAFVALYAISEAIKLILMEPRPCTGAGLNWINRVGCESGYSLPSNHAVALTGPYLFLKGYKYLRVLYPVWLILVLFGRVYLGQHYLTDVLAGVVISVLLAYVVYRNEKRINRFFISHLGIKM